MQKRIDFQEVHDLEKIHVGGIRPQNEAGGPIGLALSGGGIRSATFSLGVLQALAAKGKLASFDYLSTVSGGGYIGAWLSAWIRRAGLSNVQKQLGASGSGHSPTPKADEPEEVSWLRRYSNYLTPRVGLFSTDSLTLITTWLRNVLLSLIIVVAFLAVIMLVPRVLIPVVKALAVENHDALGYLAAWLGIVLFPAALLANLLHMERRSEEARFWMVTTRGVGLTVLLPGVAASVAAGLWWFSENHELSAKADARPALLVLILPTLVWLGWIVVKLWRAAKFPEYAGARLETAMNVLKGGAVFAVAGVVAVSVGMALLVYARTGIAFHRDTAAGPAVLLTVGPPAFLIAFGIAGSIFVGLVGRVYFERSREWWSRMNAGFLTIGAAWVIVTACAFYVPALVYWMQASAQTWFKNLIAAGWLASLVGALLTPKPNALSKRAENNVMALVGAAAMVFMVGFVIAVATGTDYALTTAAGVERITVERPAKPSQIDLKVSGTQANIDAHINVASHTVPALHEFRDAGLGNLDALVKLEKPAPIPFLWMALGSTLAVLLVFGWRVDVNKFSLHNLYKNRLIRCYLGASNAKRNPQPFTGFDDEDDFLLADLGTDLNGPQTPAPQRPFHIINTALNISQGKNLAWQERKAASFALTPLFSGFALGSTQGEAAPAPAFLSTRTYAAEKQEDRGFTLGMAIATSGAAASPNMGPATSPALAFVLTLFNVRIGRWSPNPAQSKCTRASPRFGLLCLLQELFGLSNEESSFVYLSDGGHFDNMGIYELIRRRCRLIWLVDASGDPSRSCGDLARAIRQCRIDFGVEIKIDLDPMRAGDQGALPAQGFARGVIHYGGKWPDGVIVYIKPTLCQKTQEPIDVLNYAVRNKTFPHQTTGDQFFDESQFESYRRLGLHIGELSIASHGDDLPAVAPPGLQRPQQAAKPRIPHPLGWWFRWLTLGTFAGLAMLEGYRAWLMPAYGRELWLWIDNAWVVVYTAMFVTGFLLIRNALFSTRKTVSKVFLWCTMSLAVAGALCDYGENFQLLARGDIGDMSVACWSNAKWAIAGLNLTLLLILGAIACLRTPPKSRWP